MFYVVCRYDGLYEDEIVTPICVYRDEEKAKRHVELAEAEVKHTPQEKKYDPNRTAATEDIGYDYFGAPLLEEVPVTDEKKIKKKKKKCWDCDGTGAKPLRSCVFGSTTCETCKGSGYLEEELEEENGSK